MDVTNITCSFCDKPASFFYKNKKTGKVCGACIADNEILFKNTLIIDVVKIIFTEIKKEEVLNFLKMNDALE